ncbi:MAG TPA: DUF3556 domain-containing protein, partial [Nitriliruptorales bacterium]
MGLIAPDLPDYDVTEWQALPYPEQVRLACRSWALQGFGAPAVIYLFYAAKVALFVGGWALFVGATPGLGGMGEIGTWWHAPIAFQKAVVWALAFEVLGFGCASGPLTARYLPPISAFLSFTRPGTVRLPPWPDRVPGTAGTSRTWLDVALYVGLHVTLVRALLAGSVGPAQVWPIIVALMAAGLRDKTVFLAGRSEQYGPLLLVMLFPSDLIPGAKLVALAVWWGAATSKLNHHFPSVVAVMVSNSPFLRWRRLRRAMYRDFPDDLRPGRIPTWLAHGGTAVEYGFPILLVLGDGGVLTVIGLVVMVAFHGFITLSVPMGVPIEWNVYVVYAGFVLFGANADVSLWAFDSRMLVVLLLLAVVAVPVYGNLRPDRVSFLPSMRYYAGNWAASVWLLRPEALDRIDERVTKVAGDVPAQLGRFYDPETAVALAGKALAFRSMHLHGRVLNRYIPRAVENPEAYELRDGELMAGVVLGWNFGDGHLHHEQLMGALQERCGFEPGDVR